MHTELYTVIVFTMFYSSNLVYSQLANSYSQLLTYVYEQLCVLPTQQQLAVAISCFVVTAIASFISTVHVIHTTQLQLASQKYYKCHTNSHTGMHFPFVVFPTHTSLGIQYVFQYIISMCTCHTFQLSTKFVMSLAHTLLLAS